MGYTEHTDHRSLTGHAKTSQAKASRVAVLKATYWVETRIKKGQKKKKMGMGAKLYKDLFVQLDKLQSCKVE